MHTGQVYDSAEVQTMTRRIAAKSDRTRADNELERNGHSGPGSSSSLLSLFAPHAALRGTFKVSHWHYQTSTSGDWQSRPDLTMTVKLIPY